MIYETLFHIFYITLDTLVGIIQITLILKASPQSYKPLQGKKQNKNYLMTKLWLMVLETSSLFKFWSSQGNPEIHLLPTVRNRLFATLSVLKEFVLLGWNHSWKLIGPKLTNFSCCLTVLLDKKKSLRNGGWSK